MRQHRYVSSAIFAVAASVIAEPSPPPLPVARAPFARSVELSRQKPVLETTDFFADGKAHTGALFRVGDKTVMACGRNEAADLNHAIAFGKIPIMAGEELIGTILLDSVGGKPAATNGLGDVMRVDRDAASVTWTRQIVHESTGTTNVFAYTLRALDDSRVEFSYDAGMPQAEADALRLGFGGWFMQPANLYTNREFGFGAWRYEPRTRAALRALSNPMKQTATHAKDVATTGTLAFYPGDPQKTISIELPPDILTNKCDFIERLLFPGEPYERQTCSLVFASRRARNRIVIDLHESTSSSGAESPEPPVNGLDFWAQDAYHVPVKPTANQMVNGSFEQNWAGWRPELGYSQWKDVPTGNENFAIVEGGRFGHRALLARGTQPRVPCLASAPMQLESGKTYTASLWARRAVTNQPGAGVRFSIHSMNCAGGNLPWAGHQCAASANLNDNDGTWTRVSTTFTADNMGYYLRLDGWNARVDGIMVAEGTNVADYVEAPISGRLLSADPDNLLAPGGDYALRAEFQGRPHSKAFVTVSVRDFYFEEVFRKKSDLVFDGDGLCVVPLDVDPARLGEGVFVVRFDYGDWTDYSRFAVFTPLRGDTATARFFCGFAKFPYQMRGREIARRQKEWGFNATDGARLGEYIDSEGAKLFREFDIVNYVHPIAYELQWDRELNKERNDEFAWNKPGLRDWITVTPERIALAEELAYKYAMRTSPDDNIWCFWNEDENWARKAGVANWVKYHQAVKRGAERAFRERGLPPPLLVPTHGTSHYFRGRNYDIIDAYMEESNRQGFKYDAITLHPYSNIDGGVLGPHDMDVEIGHLIARMDHYGYGDTPFFFTECFNMLPMYIPQWGADAWADPYACMAMPSMALGNREFLQAASLARLYVVCLQWWPRLRFVHPWLGLAGMDLDMTPWMYHKAVNTVARLFADPSFHGSAQPFSDVRGYCFKRKGEKAVLAVWTTNHDVELGKRIGPVLTMDLPPDTEALDLMGNPRAISRTGADGSSVEVPLTAAPIFLLSSDPDALLTALRDADTDDRSFSLRIDFSPDVSGAVTLHLENMTKRPQTGVLRVGASDVAYDLGPRGTQAVRVAGERALAPLSPVDWEADVPILGRTWHLRYFTVPRCGEKPDWAGIPSCAITNPVLKPGFSEAGIRASFQAAYNDEAFFLRVEIEDPDYVPAAAFKKPGPTELFLYDDALEVFFDAFADARSHGEADYDENDSRYDFAEDRVNRLRAVNWQLAQGTQSATDEEVREKLRPVWTKTETGCVYEIRFDARYMAPIELKKGTVAGLGLFIHNRAKADERWSNGLSFSTRPGVPCDHKPVYWPLMVFE